MANQLANSTRKANCYKHWCMKFLETKKIYFFNRKKKQILKEKRKLRDKMNLNMIIPGDKQIDEDREVFHLGEIKKQQVILLYDFYFL